MSEHSEAACREHRMLGALLHGMPGVVTAEPEPLDEPEPLVGALVVTPEPPDEYQCYSVQYHCVCKRTHIFLYEEMIEGMNEGGRWWWQPSGLQ